MPSLVKSDPCIDPQVASALQEVRRLSVALTALERRIEMILSALEEHSPAEDSDAANTSKSSAITHDDHDDFTLIRGIDDAAVKILSELGLTHYRDIAACTPEDVEAVGKAIGNPNRLSEENWIEQAALLAKGIETAYSREQKLSLSEAAAPTLDLAPALPSEMQLPTAVTQCVEPMLVVNSEKTSETTQSAVDVVDGPAPNVVSLLQYRLRRQTIISQTVGWSAAAASIAIIIGIVFGLGSTGSIKALQLSSTITSEVTEAISQVIALATDD